jgi:hypothetical protein
MVPYRTFDAPPGAHGAAPLAQVSKIGYSLPVRAISRSFLALLAFLSLASCVDIDTRIRFQGDGSGTISLSYRVSHLIVDLGKGGEATWSVPLPITEEDFRRSLEGVSGVTLTRFSRKEDEKDLILQADLSFDKVESLSKIESFRSSEPSLSISGSTSSYRQVVLHAEKEPVSSDSLAMLDALFEGYGISYAIEAPSAIRNHGIGTVGSDGKTLTWKSTIKELIQSRTDTVLTVSW